MLQLGKVEVLWFGDLLDVCSEGDKSQLLVFQIIVKIENEGVR